VTAIFFGWDSTRNFHVADDLDSLAPRRLSR
jgi:hypothetical protein